MPVTPSSLASRHRHPACNLRGRCAGRRNARVTALEQRGAEIESQQDQGPPFTFGSGLQTEVDFYGYLKLGAIYDLRAELGNTARA